MKSTNDPILTWGALINLLCWSVVLIIDIHTQRHGFLIAFHIALVIIWAVLFEARLKLITRLIARIRQQTEFRRLTRERRAGYKQFKRDVKTGLIPGDEFEDEAKRVIR